MAEEPAGSQVAAGTPVGNFAAKDLEHSWCLKLFAGVVKGFVRLMLLRWRAPIRTFGQERVPRRGGLLIFSNHLSNTDPVVVQIACPRLINFMARRQLFEMKGVSSVLKLWKAFPVTQSSADTAAIRTAIALAQRGHAVGVFPEGQLSPDGNLIELLPGAALLVRRARVPCICVGLKNTNRLMPHPDVTPRVANATLEARWGELKVFDERARADDVMDWVESELRRLTGQEL